MKKWKSALIIIVGILLISIFFFFVPIDGIFRNLPLLKGFYQNTTLEITTPNGKASVKIDGKDYGETPASIKNLSAGSHRVELLKSSPQEGFYKTHIFNIQLTKNSVSVINIEIGTDDNLHGVVIHYVEDSTKESGKGKITVSSNAQDARVYINEDFLKNTPVTNVKLNNGEYNIKLRMNNFEDLQFPVIVREGYILNVKGYQLPLPITFEGAIDNE